jgi:hypothetical protein
VHGTAEQGKKQTAMTTTEDYIGPSARTMLLAASHTPTVTVRIDVLFFGGFHGRGDVYR